MGTTKTCLCAVWKFAKNRGRITKLFSINSIVKVENIYQTLHQHSTTSRRCSILRSEQTIFTHFVSYDSKMIVRNRIEYFIAVPQIHIPTITVSEKQERKREISCRYSCTIKRKEFPTIIYSGLTKPVFTVFTASVLGRYFPLRVSKRNDDAKCKTIPQHTIFIFNLRGINSSRFRYKVPTSRYWPRCKAKASAEQLYRSVLFEAALVLTSSSHILVRIIKMLKHISAVIST